MFRSRVALALALTCGVAFLAAAALTGCGPKEPEKNLLADPALEDPGGYYEVQYKGATYVLASPVTVDKLREGTGPTTLPSGFSPEGRPVYFETGAVGMEQRLRGEYARRHPPRR